METVVSLFGVQPIRIGGVEIFARELSCALAEHGWKSVAVFSAPPAGRVREFLTAPNLSVEVCPRLETSRCDPSVTSILRRYRPKILHAHFIDILSPYPWLGRLHSAEKFFFTSHGSHPEGYIPGEAPGWKRLAARAINAPLTGVFCVSEYNRRTLAAANLLPPSRLHRIYDAILLPPLQERASQAEEFRRRHSIPAGRDLVTQVSWIIPEKGILDLLEAARLVIAQRTNTHFAIVGSGNSLQSFQARAHEIGIGGHVTWTGLVENPMREGVYAAAHVFCLTSRWEEAFGWVIAEAMSFETPVVATAVGGIPEVVSDGETGFLAARGDARSIAEKILRLLADPDLRVKMGRAGRRRVEEKFDLRTAIIELLRYYEVDR